LKIFLQIFTTICFFVATEGRAQTEYTLTGEYQGKDLYVQNPLSNDKLNFCTREVYVNDQIVITSPKTSAFAIDLSDMRPGDPILIKIVHKEGCVPKIINPQVIRSKSSFQYLNTSADAISINWVTRGELSDGKFIVEHYQNKNWVAQHAVAGKGSFETNQYSVIPMHHTAENKYRIKYVQNDGKTFFSRIFEYYNDVDPVSFYPALVTDKITLSRESDYAVVDSYGNQVVKGRATEIQLKNLSSGLYFLHIDNREERFVKK